MPKKRESQGSVSSGSMEKTLATTSAKDDDPVNSDGNGNHGSLADVAYNSVFRMILQRELASGTVIQERKLADSLGISRTPMREALKRLEGEGWLVRLTDRLSSVKVVTLDEYLQALQVRRLWNPRPLLRPRHA